MQEIPELRMPAFARRTNMAEARSERWRPPLFAPAASKLSRLKAAARRFFDLQAGSAWRDLREILPALHGVVLDVGCGAQPFRPLLRHPAAIYRGIDTDNAKEHFGYEMPDTAYFSGEVWPAEDASADAVLCTETLEHVFEARAFLAQAARCLKGGGALVLTVPFAARWHFIPYDYWRFTPSSLKMLLEAAGFGSVRVYARGNACTVACYKSMALILLLLMPQTAPGYAVPLLRLLGLAFLPAFVLLAAIANLSLRGRGGDDCLGYTVIAARSPGSREPDAEA